MSHSARRAGVLAGVVATATCLFAGPAAAHVTVQPSTATAGGHASLSFTVPTEKEAASTTGLELRLPTDVPVASVSVQPKAGWTYQITRVPLARPLPTDDGEVRDVVTRVVWTAHDGAGIRPGESDAFTIAAGPLPEGVDHLAFGAVQTYSDGTVTRWTDIATPDQPEPALPAPVLALSPATGDAHAGPGAATSHASASSRTGPSDGLARAISLAGLGTGIAALVIGVVAMATSRQRRAEPIAPSRPRSTAKR
ncbi:conserved exported hypothetical protein [Frankia canadensis]|uniref:YncI copper-binding domain-containing protein n=1 Tax=Frankia canadensis TaxID=1836972 RepID=A0A2I2L066_9ACTN|nr:YcnI family protein [Frankia canadensis]SNQ51299.1 conserved exported hypothetical protein [Frankia canadensis]SOU58589.1 conserved exported hypothetical protein [Frankia canadensis]